MSDIRIRGPLALFAEWIVKGNARTLVIRRNDRTLAAIPLGYVMIAGTAAVLATPPLIVVVALLALCGSGVAIAVEDPAPTRQVQAVAVVSWQHSRLRRMERRAGRQQR